MAAASSRAARVSRRGMVLIYAPRQSARDGRDYHPRPNAPKRIRSIVLLPPLAVAACSAPPDKPQPAAPAGVPQLGTFGVDLGGMDRTVPPGDDFYAFVNGNWAKRTAIP